MCMVGTHRNVVRHVRMCGVCVCMFVDVSAARLIGRLGQHGLFMMSS